MSKFLFNAPRYTQIFFKVNTIFWLIHNVLFEKSAIIFLVFFERKRKYENVCFFTKKSSVIKNKQAKKPLQNKERFIKIDEKLRLFFIHRVCCICIRNNRWHMKR